jgi:23S rRNA pseudouridine1911/1915/1917 synthase
MICAKNEKTLKFLQKQFQDRKVQKTYIAITEHCPQEPEAIIDAPIGRNTKDPKKFHITPDGKAAKTHYKILKSEKGKTKFILMPSTGRTHQLRIHLAYINCPIIGDELYGGLKNDRLLLHANVLEIKLLDGKKHLFEAKLPEEFNF